MFDRIFLILISIFFPIIVFTGYKILKGKNYRKIEIALTLALLGMEILRFFCNAVFYTGRITPCSDVKFGYITLLCIVALFATFVKNPQKKDVLTSIFYSTALIPIILGLFNTKIFINALDVNAVCKSLYMLECGAAITIALGYIFEKEIKFSGLNILWASLFTIAYIGIDALIIWHWKIDIAFNLNWYMGWLVALLSICIIYAVNILCHKFVNKKKTKAVVKDLGGLEK